MYSDHKKILIIDDDAQIREIAVNVLKTLGYKAYSANDGETAIELYQQAMDANQSFDAVILDLTIPYGMGGKETIIELKKIDPNVKAIISSGYSSDPVILEYKKYGFSGAINKPYRIEELAQIIKQVLDDEKE
jgi:CheY-like chemotaxis protein